MSGAASLLAFPACALVLFGLLRSPAARRIVSPPRPDRWHKELTPQFGGIGIFAGIVTGTLAALALGAVHGSHKEVLGILAGCSILFVFGLIDDTFYLPPIGKLIGQFSATAVVLFGGGLSVTLVGNHWVALAIAVTWLVGMTNAFNLLDNMDGLAASLAAIAALFFAIDAVAIHPNRTVAVLSLSILAASVGFLPFNIWPGRKAAAFMGDSGSQTLGFALAAVGLASTWKVAETTVATLILPLFVLAVPILDTTLVTIVRLLEGRPIYQGGRDHTSHRLVLRGLSERRAVVLLAVISVLLGATCLAYMVIHDNKITAIGVLLTFALLIQFGSFLAEVERQPLGQLDVRPPLLRTFIVNRRRLIEVIVDGALIAAAFYGAYVLRIGSNGTPDQQKVFLWTFPVILFARYLVFIPFGLYRGVWRYAGARDAAGVIVAVALSEAIAYAFVATTRVWLDFPRSVFLIDLLLCSMLVGASRFWERAAHRGLSSLHGRGQRRRTLIVGAGRTGRSLMRELRETPGEQVIGFIDDDPRLWRRRLQGVPVLGSADEAARVVHQARPDRVLVTIPGAPRERLEFVADACAEAGVPCRFLRQEFDLEPSPALRADVE